MNPAKRKKQRLAKLKIARAKKVRRKSSIPDGRYRIGGGKGSGGKNPRLHRAAPFTP